jgi:subtilisin family serine protease
MRMRSAAIVLLAVSLVFPSIAAGKPNRSKQRWTPSQVLVKTKNGAAPEIGKHGVKRAQKLFGKFKLKGKAAQHAAARGLDRVYLIDLDRDEVEAAIAQFSKDPNVEYAEPNWRIEFPAVPNDPSFGTQWGLAKIGAPAAWDHATSGSGVVIGIVDTGIDLTHPDLAANIWTNPGEIAGNNVDDDGNGFVDDIHGWDFWNNDNDPTDTNGHGTRVAGIAAAAGNNATGVSGVAWSAKVAALRMGVEFGDVATAVQALEYANMMGFRITNNSWGWWEGGGTFLLDDVVNTGEAEGYLFVVAAGNEGKDNDWLPSYPSHYDNSNVIAVTATNQTDTLPSWANWGARSVDLGAPGETIDSTTRGGSYGSGSGSSFSAPFVAGAAALYWTAHPSATHVQVRDAIFNTTDPLPALHGKSVTGGRLSLANLFDPETTAPAAIGDLTVTDTTFRSVFVRFTATGDDGAAGTAARYDVRVSTAPITEANFASATPLTGKPIPQAAGTLETFKLTGLASSTAYYIAVRALDNAANAGPISNVATFTTGRAAVLFDDNVEGGARAWTVEGSDGNGGPALWHIEPMYGLTTVWTYTTGTYGYNTGARNYGSLISPEFDLAQARDSRLRFSQWVWTERHFLAENAAVQISVDGGAWTNLLVRMITIYGTSESLDLSAYDGHRVRVRFFLDTVDAILNDYPGWQVDNVVLEATSTNAPPVANLNGPYSVTEDQQATLSSAGSSDPEGAALEYKWSFGDGTFAYTTSTSVTHTWTLPGNHTVTLTAYDGKNSSDPVTTTVSPAAVNDRPVAHIDMSFATPPYLEETDIRVTWFGSSDEENAPLQCHFDYGDGSTIDRTCEGSWTHVWSRPGTYTITLIVNDGQLASLPATQSITILEASNDKPVARAGGPYDAQPNQAITLDGSASSDEETSIASYLWTFPDGTTSTDMRPSKAFASSGVKTPTLVVTDQTGLASQPATAQVRVCGGAVADLFGGGWSQGYTCPGGTYRVGVNVTGGILPLTLTWSDGFVQNVTSLSNGYYAERVVTPSQRTTYALSSITDFLGCAGTAGTTTNTIDFASVALTVPTVTTCPGQSIYLTPTYKGSGPWTVTWSDGYVQTITGGNSDRSVSPSETTTYSIVSATCASCPAGTTPLISGSTTVRVIGAPNVVVSGSSVSCNNATVSITATITGGEPPYMTTWSDGVTYSSNGTFTRSVPAAATPYTITRITSGICVGTSSGSATVTSGTRPSAVVSGGGNFCAGSAGVTISAALTGTAPFSIVWSDGFTETVSGNSSTRQVSPASTTNYTITSITSGGCSGTSTGSATATRIAPSAVVSGGGTFCAGSSVSVRADLTGPYPFTVVWSDGFTETVGANSTIRYVSPASATTYTVASLTAGGCNGTTSGSATATPRALPAATVSGGGTSCNGSSVTLSAALTGPGPFTLTWSDGFVQTVASGNTATRLVTPASTTTYTLNSVSNNCLGSASGSATVTVASPPTATVSGGGSFCPGSAGATLVANLTGNAPFTIVWSDGFTQTTSIIPATRQVAPAAATTYTITSVTGAGCSGTASGSATATPRTPPTAVVSGGGAFCEGSSVNIVATLTGSAPFTVTWSDGVVQNIPSGNTATRAAGPATTTVYTVSAFADGTCSGTASGSATATPTRKPVITQQPQSKTIAKNTATTISVSTTESGLSYQWYQGASGTTTTPVGTSSSSFTTPKLRSNTQYWVKIWKNGCASYPTNSQTATITVQ